MPHQTSPAPAEGVAEGNLDFKWTDSPDGSRSMVRKLTNLERMFVIFNEKLYGQNCALLGANISLRRQALSQEKGAFDFAQLQKRATEAFCALRWKYPTVAARVADGDKAVYNIESEEDVKKWAGRAVSIVTEEGGWVATRERVSREAAIPSPAGDYCIVYITVHPDEVAKPELKEFDVLIHTHHAFTDGSGIRALLNEFLDRLADPLDPKEMVWGEETTRLLPASLLLEKDDEPEASSEEVAAPAPEKKLRAFDQVGGFKDPR